MLFLNKTKSSEVNVSKEEKKDSDFSQNSKTFFSSTSNAYSLMMKNHFKSSSFYLGNLVVPIFMVLSLSIVFPIWYSFIWMLFLPLLFTGFSTYGTLFFTVKKSTMMKNINMTVNESSSLYFATLMVMFMTAVITLLVVLVSLFTLDMLGIASHEFAFNQDPAGNSEIFWGEIWWSMIVYYVFAEVIITFALCFFIEQITSTQKNFFITCFIYLMLALFFGGTWSSSLAINEDYEVYVRTIDDVSDLSTGSESQAVMPSYQAFGVTWWISQLCPHYGLNQVAFSTMEAGTYINPDPNNPDVLYSQWHNVNMLHPDTALNNGVAYYMFMPWAYVAFYIWIAGILARYNKK